MEPLLNLAASRTSAAVTVIGIVPFGDPGMMVPFFFFSALLAGTGLVAGTVVIVLPFRKFVRDSPADLDTAPRALPQLFAGYTGNRLPLPEIMTENLAYEFFHGAILFFEEQGVLFCSENFIPAKRGLLKNQDNDRTQCVCCL